LPEPAKGKPQKQEKSHDSASYMKVAMKVFPGLSLCGATGAHCTKHVKFLSAQARSPCNKAAQTAHSNSVGADFACFPLQGQAYLRNLLQALSATALSLWRSRTRGHWKKYRESMWAWYQAFKATTMRRNWKSWA
jgi:hypothetical protein